MEHSKNPSLIDWAKQNGAKKLELVDGPNGQFISMTKADGQKMTMPVGKKSQNGKLADYKVLTTDDGVAVATVNNYETVEAIEL